MTYTITVKPTQTPGKVTAASTNGHSLTTTTPLLDSARYWLTNGANLHEIITTIWSSGSGHWSLRSTISNAASLVAMGDRFQKAKQSRIPAPHAIISLTPSQIHPSHSGSHLGIRVPLRLPFPVRV
jgi:hypothetical protein